jgi:hypothetical protein
LLRLDISIGSGNLMFSLPEPAKKAGKSTESGPKKVVKYPIKEFFVILFLFFAYVLISLPGFISASTRANIAKTKSEFRSITSDLDSFFQDNKIYSPGYVYVGDISAVSELSPELILPDSEYLKDADYIYLLNLRKIGRYIAIAFIISAVLWLIVLNIMAGAENTLKLFALFLCLLIIYLFAIKIFDNIHFFIFMTAGFISLHGFLWFVIRFIQDRLNRISVPREEFMIAIYIPLVVVTTLLVYLIGIAAIGKKTPIDERKPYQYATDGNSTWILQSTGPDADYDLDLVALFPHDEYNNQLLSLDEDEFETKIQEYSYDPTNGTYSNGDILRTRPESQ